MLFIEMGSICEANEELRAIRVWTGVGHGQNSFVSMRVPDLLIVKVFAVNTLSTCTIAVCNVTTLCHEAWDYPMEAIA